MKIFGIVLTSAIIMGSLQALPHCHLVQAASPGIVLVAAWNSSRTSHDAHRLLSSGKAPAQCPRHVALYQKSNMSVPSVSCLKHGIQQRREMRWEGANQAGRGMSGPVSRIQTHFCPKGRPLFFKLRFLVAKCSNLGTAVVVTRDAQELDPELSTAYYSVSMFANPATRQGHPR